MTTSAFVLCSLSATQVVLSQESATYSTYSTAKPFIKQTSGTWKDLMVFKSKINSEFKQKYIDVCLWGLNTLSSSHFKRQILEYCFVAIKWLSEGSKQQTWNSHEKNWQCAQLVYTTGVAPGKQLNLSRSQFLIWEWSTILFNL